MAKYGGSVKAGKYHRNMEEEAKRPQPKEGPRSPYTNPTKGRESTDAGTPREKL